MPLRSLVTQLQQAALTGELLERTQRDDRLLMRGAGRGSRALVASAMAQRRNCPLLVVVPTLEEAGRWTSLLELMGWGSTSLYPTSEGSPYEPFDPTSEIIWGQLQVLSDLLGDSSPANPGAIVATERCLQPHLPPPDALRGICRTLRKGDEIDLEQLGETLAQLGYQRVSSIDCVVLLFGVNPFFLSYILIWKPITIFLHDLLMFWIRAEFPTTGKCFQHRSRRGISCPTTIPFTKMVVPEICPIGFEALSLVISIGMLDW